MNQFICHTLFYHNDNNLMLFWILHLNTLKYMIYAKTVIHVITIL